MTARPYSTCLACGKIGYWSRKAAKKAAREQGLGTVSAYQCFLIDAPMWHLGHLPLSVKKGWVQRGDTRIPPPRPVRYRKH